jgi:type IV pilus assembly protein PilY1
MMAMLPVGLLPTSTATFASDLTLYKGNTTGKTSILLMLDTSGSMGISSLVLPSTNQYRPGDVTTPLCERVDVKEYKNDYKIQQQ